MTPRARSIALTIAVALVGCGEEIPAAGENVDSPTSAENLLPRTAPPLQLELVTTLSGDDLVAGRIGDFLADGEGRLYVTDELAQEILVLDREGRRIQTLGGSGGGPGEFGALISIAWQRDTLAALDLRNRRVTRFTADGAVVSAWPWTPEAGRPVSLRSAGETVYAIGSISRTDGAGFRSAAEASAASRQPELRYSAFTAAGEMRPFPAVTDTGEEARGFDCDGPAGTIETFAPLFPRAGPLRAFPSSQTIALASPDAYRIDVVDLTSGDTVRTVARDYPSRPVTATDWERATRSYRERDREVGRLGCDLERMRPQRHPVIRSIVADELGRLWVEAATEDGYTIGVIDGQGRLIGEAPLPPRDERIPLHVRAGHLHLVTIDSLGVQSIQVYEIGVAG